MLRSMQDREQLDDLRLISRAEYDRMVEADIFDEDEVIRAHALEPVPPLRPRVTGWLPRELEDLILRCLAKRPQERPDDARALLRELRAIPIPPEHAWTDEQAREWWAKYQQPTAEPNAPAAPGTSVERVLVPQRDEPGVPAIGPEAATIDQRRSERALRQD